MLVRLDNILNKHLRCVICSNGTYKYANKQIQLSGINDEVRNDMGRINIFG